MAKLIGYLPKFYQGIQEFVEISDIEDAELELLHDNMNMVFSNQFILTSSEKAVLRREKMFNIKADVNYEDLEFRRVRLVNRQSSRPPFTIRYLKQLLSTLTNSEDYSIDVDIENFLVEVKFQNNNQSIPQEILNTLERVLPMNLNYNIHEVFAREMKVIQEFNSISYDFLYFTGHTLTPGEKSINSNFTLTQTINVYQKISTTQKVYNEAGVYFSGEVYC